MILSFCLNVNRNFISIMSDEELLYVSGGSPIV